MDTRIRPDSSRTRQNLRTRYLNWLNQGALNSRLLDAATCREIDINIHHTCHIGAESRYRGALCFKGGLKGAELMQ